MGIDFTTMPTLAAIATAQKLAIPNDPATAIYVSNEELLPLLARLIAEAASEPERVREVTSDAGSSQWAASV